MRVEQGEGSRERPPQVVRLVPKRRAPSAILRDFRDLLGELLGELRGSDLDAVIDPEIVTEIEPFLQYIQDATCYRVVSRQEEAFCWSHYHRMSVRAMILEGLEHAPAWEVLLKRIRESTDRSSDGSVMVSLVLCQPNSLVFRELKETYAYVDLRSGVAWDLHLIGYKAINRHGNMKPSVLGIPTWRFNAGRFLDVVAHIQYEHAAALADSEDAPAGRPWRYSGTADLVSFMAYWDFPGLIDWPSLRAVQLLDAQGAYLDRSMGQIVEIMSDWSEDGPEVREFAPGELQQTAISVLDLRRALIAVAGMVTSGIVGNAAYDLLKKLLGLTVGGGMTQRPAHPIRLPLPVWIFELDQLWIFACSQVQFGRHSPRRGSFRVALSALLSS